MAFKPAVRSQARLRLALCGISGSGKTYTAIMMAKMFATKLAVIDTERGSASKYARADDGQVGPGRWDFDVDELSKKGIQEYLVSMSDAARAGYDGLIIDSYSHSWVASLEMVDALGKVMGWKTVSPLVAKLVDAVYDYPGHVFATFRAKQEHAIDKDENGRVSVRKMGLGAVARDGAEYEFDCWLDLGQRGVITIGKSRVTGLVEGSIHQREDIPTIVQLIKDWLATGAPPAPRVSTPVDVALADFAACKTYDALLEAGKAVHASTVPGLSEADKAKLRDAFSARKLELETK